MKFSVPSAPWIPGLGTLCSLCPFPLSFCFETGHDVRSWEGWSSEQGVTKHNRRVKKITGFLTMTSSSFGINASSQLIQSLMWREKNAFGPKPLVNWVLCFLQLYVIYPASSLPLLHEQNPDIVQIASPLHSARSQGIRIPAQVWGVGGWHWSANCNPIPLVSVKESVRHGAG